MLFLLLKGGWEVCKCYPSIGRVKISHRRCRGWARPCWSPVRISGCPGRPGRSELAAGPPSFSYPSERGRARIIAINLSSPWPWGPLVENRSAWPPKPTPAHPGCQAQSVIPREGPEMKEQFFQRFLSSKCDSWSKLASPIVSQGVIK